MDPIEMLDAVGDGIGKWIIRTIGLVVGMVLIGGLTWMLLAFLLMEACK